MRAAYVKMLHLHDAKIAEFQNTMIKFSFKYFPVGSDSKIDDDWRGDYSLWESVKDWMHKDSDFVHLCIKMMRVADSVIYNKCQATFLSEKSLRHILMAFKIIFAVISEYQTGDINVYKIHGPLYLWLTIMKLETVYTCFPKEIDEMKKIYINYTNKIIQSPGFDELGGPLLVTRSINYFMGQYFDDKFLDPDFRNGECFRRFISQIGAAYAENDQKSTLTKVIKDYIFGIKHFIQTRLHSLIYRVEASDQ